MKPIILALILNKYLDNLKYLDNRTPLIDIRQFFTHKTFPNPDSSKFSTIKILHYICIWL